jgi:putative PIN family toxin of toxin-antitoxin system
VVFDANVVIAAFGFDGVCRSVLESCVDSHRVVLSDHILAEVHSHLRKKMGHPLSMADERVTFLREIATLVEPAPVRQDACRDPEDLPVLGTLVAAHADCLVTGDSDLLVLGRFGDQPILSPREFSEWGKSQPEG